MPGCGLLDVTPLHAGPDACPTAVRVDRQLAQAGRGHEHAILDGAERHGTVARALGHQPQAARTREGHELDDIVDRLRVGDERGSLVGREVPRQSSATPAGVRLGDDAPGQALSQATHVPEMPFVPRTLRCSDGALGQVVRG